MIPLLKCEGVVIVTDWTKYVISKIPKKKVRRSRPRKRERSTRRSTWESGVRRFVISWSIPSISSHRQYQSSHPNHCQCLHHQLIAGSDDNDGEENREATAEVFYKSSWLAEASKQVNMILIKEGLWKCCHRFRPRIHHYHQDSCALSGIISDNLSPLKIQIPISQTKIITTNLKQ